MKSTDAAFPSHGTPVSSKTTTAEITTPDLGTQIIAVIWLCTAGLIAALIINGRIANYVRGFWHPFLAIACILVMGISLLVLWKGRDAYRTSLQPPAHPSRIAWLVLLPCLLIVGAAPNPLGASMLANTTTAGTDNTRVRQALAEKQTGGINFPPLKDSEPNELTMEELSDRFNFDDATKMAGKTIIVTGFVSHGETGFIDASVEADAVGTNTTQPTSDTTPQPQHPTFILNRFKIYCCAADAIAYNMKVISDTDFPDDTWLTLTGQIDPDSRVLVFHATAIENIKQPKVPYL